MIDLAAYERDGFLVLPDFLPPADCDALQARAAELVAAFDPGPVRTVFSSHDQGHAKAQYFRESGGTIRFFFEEEATDQPAALALNKIGHALHDLDPVFDRIHASLRSRRWPGHLASDSRCCCSRCISSNSPGLAVRSAGTRTPPTCTPCPRP